ncbi:MAG: hypothetical protein MZU97_22115 [Bacillus subtilis]|nr:hypothetical protein [Bacillus subtilis]
MVFLLGFLVSCTTEPPMEININVRDSNIETNVRIQEVAEPYFFDLLIKKSSAPVLTPDQLSYRLPEPHRDGAFATFANGYQDADGFVSCRLYCGWTTAIRQVAANEIIFLSTSPNPIPYKILIFFNDGTTSISPIIVQTQRKANVTYDLRTIGMQEFAVVDPEPVDDLPPQTVPPRIDTFRLMQAIVIILIVMAIEMVGLFLFGYRKAKSYLIVGLIRFNWLVFSALLFTLKHSVALPILMLVFILLFSIWVLVEALFLPIWLGEKRMERTMTFAFSSNLVILLAILLLSL